MFVIFFPNTKYTYTCTYKLVPKSHNAWTAMVNKIHKDIVIRSATVNREKNDNSLNFLLAATVGLFSMYFLCYN